MAAVQFTKSLTKSFTKDICISLFSYSVKIYIKWKFVIILVIINMKYIGVQSVSTKKIMMQNVSVCGRMSLHIYLGKTALLHAWNI